MRRSTSHAMAASCLFVKPFSTSPADKSEYFDGGHDMAG